MKKFLQTNIGLILSLLGGFASLIIIVQFSISPIYTRLEHIENQVNNHIPTQIRDLRIDIKALDRKIDRINQELRTDIKALDQKFDQTNQRLDKIFEILSSKD